MAKPTTATRFRTYERDLNRCASCASPALSFQHRRAVGQGGSKTLPTVQDALTLCPTCNNHCEHTLQTRALAYGWKVRRWVTNPGDVPVFYPHEFAWFVLTDTGTREQIPALRAMEMMLVVYGDDWLTWRDAA